MIDPAFWSSTAGVAILVACALIGLAMAVRLWITRPDDPEILKYMWSIIVIFVPVVGWMLFVGLYRPPKPQGENPPPSPYT